VTADQIELVRKSFDELWPVRRKLAELFYSRFFELAPDSRRLFPDSMEKQNLKLMDALAAMVGALDQREIFQSVIRTPRTMVDFAAWGHNVGCCLQFDRRFSPLLLRPLLRSKL